MEASAVLSPLQVRADAEMFTRPRTESVFMSRPASTYTDFFDVDIDAIDDSSDFGPDSPRESFDSYGMRSVTTATSYEVPTPAIERKGALDQQLQQQYSQVQTHLHQRGLSTQGPSGPHLFRYSSESFRDIHFGLEALQLSPIQLKNEASFASIDQHTASKASKPLLQPPKTNFKTLDVYRWNTIDVSEWMQAQEIDESVIAKFEAHDIDGMVLMDLKFDDLKELDISSFGKRHQVWNAISALKAQGSASPLHTPIQDDMSRPLERSLSAAGFTPRRKRTAAPTRAAAAAGIPAEHNPISPEESVSIVAIEQLIPRPHRCSRGDRCPKYKQRERLMREFAHEHPLNNDDGSHFMLAGDPGNASTAPPLHITSEIEVVPSSLVASSDVLGPGMRPQIALQEESLRTVVRRDPQENVKQFLVFQHLHSTSSTPANAPPTPPAETPGFAPGTPGFPPTPRRASADGALEGVPRQQQQRAILPRLDTSTLSSPPMQQRPFEPGPLPTRRGTPASEADVPVPATLSALPPLDRDASQSVPPNMQFRPQQVRRPSSRAQQQPWHRRSMLPPLPEGAPVASAAAPSTDPFSVPASELAAHLALAASRRASASASAAASYGAGTTQAGWMKQRRTRLLRHEWGAGHWRLRGTLLAKHASADAADRRALAELDVDDYAVACSSLAGSGRLAAARKLLKLGDGGRRGLDDEAFLFQLVPTAVERAGLLSSKGAAIERFAVRSGDERIDWVREIMLAKARKAKEGGVEVMVNGKEI